MSNQSCRQICKECGGEGVLRYGLFKIAVKIKAFPAKVIGDGREITMEIATVKAVNVGVCFTMISPSKLQRRRKCVERGVVVLFDMVLAFSTIRFEFFFTNLAYDEDALIE